MHAMETAHITVHRASDLNGKPVAPFTINIGEPVEVLLGRQPSMQEAALAYDAEAALIADALHDHLPQATVERVLLRLMQRKVEAGSFYRGKTDN